MAITRDEAKVLYQKAIDAGYSDEEAKAAITKRIGAAEKPAPKEQLFQLSEGTGLNTLDKLKMAVNSLQRSAPGQYVTGAAQQLAETGRGARQLFNLATGDTEELERLKSEEVENQRRAEALQNPDMLSTALRGAGRGTAMLAPMALSGGAAAVPTAATTAGRVAAGAVGGALGGAAQPLQTGQGEMEERLPRAILGGVVGGAVPAAAEGGTKLLQMLRRMEPDDALQAFTKQQLGATRGGETLPAYQSVGRKVQDEEERLRDFFSEQYAKVERDASLPKVKLSAAAQGAEDAPTGLSEEVMAALSPTARKVVEGMRSGSVRKSEILDVREKPIQTVAETSFADVRQTIRDLRRTSRTLRKSEATRGQAAVVDRMQDNLQADLDSWAARGAKMDEALKKAGDIDSAYRRDVVPFDDVQTSLGKFGRTNQYDEQTLDRLFMNAQSGQSIQDLLRRVPGTEKDLRQIYGSKLLESRGKVGSIRQMEGGTAGEVLLKPQEREYLTKIADTMRGEAPSGQVQVDLIRDLKKLPGIRKMIKSVSGVDPYAEAQRGVYSTQYLVDALRSALIGQSVTGGE